uniref:hypothetical protein n=1 Tax=Porphyridium aerugineum TaxID=2792 RepID=UPI001FCCC6BA|nr:hypothetical protein MW505_pgp160 [Porphyridium aerugineum]UNJ17837.1 hypothetical protein [Porphyridium aerugineum]
MLNYKPTLLAINYNSSTVFQQQRIADIWLFNCIEGTQRMLSKEKIKVNHISKIFLSDFTINNFNGLIGLIATFNLAGRNQPLNIYAPKELNSYLFAIIKYSQTNFSFQIILRDINKNLVYCNSNFCFYILKIHKYNNHYIYKIIEKQRAGQFKIDKALNYGLRPSIIYKKLKNKINFISFNGISLQGEDFCLNSTMGSKNIISPNYFSSRYIYQYQWNKIQKNNNNIKIYNLMLFYHMNLNNWEYLNAFL